MILMTAEPEKNPYRPGVGTKPRYLAGRATQVRRFGSLLRAAPEQPANMRLTGLRGVGKTSLLQEFEERAQEEGWVAPMLELEPGHNTNATLEKAISMRLQRSRERISVGAKVRKAVGSTARYAAKGINVGYQDLSFSFSPGAVSKELPRELFDTVDLALKKGHKGVILLLDEAQVIRDETKSSGEHPLSMLISSVSVMQQKEIPVGLVLCGLPTLGVNLLRARSYTERMFRAEKIGSLKEGDAREAFARPLVGSSISAEEDLIQRVVEEVEGYPYFIQMWGAELWEAARENTIKTMNAKLLDPLQESIYDRLDGEFYDQRVESLTPAEEEVLMASTECSYPPLKVSEFKESVNKTPGNINVLLGRLVEVGVLYRSRKGEYKYTAPKFREYLIRRKKRASEG